MIIGALATMSLPTLQLFLQRGDHMEATQQVYMMMAQARDKAPELNRLNLISTAASATELFILKETRRCLDVSPGSGI